MENLNAAGPGMDHPPEPARRNPGAVMKLIKVSAILLALAAAPSRSENYREWRSSAAITLNTTATGANLKNPVTGFPLLVRLTEKHAEIFANSKSNGADIRFTDSTGLTRLPHQVERWDKQNQKAEIWVLLEEVPAETQTVLRMFWNNPDASNLSSGAEVFTTDTYKDVWHMGNAAAPASPRLSSVSGGTAANPVGNAGPIAVKTVEGPGGPADSLRGNGRGTGFIGDHFVLNSSAYQVAGEFSVSMWVKPATNRASHFLDIGTPDGGSNTQAIWMGQTTGNALTAQTQPSDAGQSATGLLTPETWQHAVYTVTSDGTHYLYRNGARVASFAGDQSTSYYRTHNYLGRSGWTADSTYRGVLDEVAVSTVPRDSNWARLSYETQKPGANAVTVELMPQQVFANKVNLSGDHHYTSSIFERGELTLEPAEGYRQTTVEYVGGTANSSSTMSVGTGGIYGTYLPAGSPQNMNFSLTSYGLSINDNISYSGPKTSYLDGTSLSTTTVNATTVNASQVTASEMVVTPKWQSWPDYVFSADHKALSLPEIEAYIRANNRLPDMPSAQEVGEKGVGLGEMNMKLLKAVEELTLHVIALDKQLKAKSSLDR